MEKQVILLDGPSSSGKSSLAQHDVGRWHRTDICALFFYECVGRRI